MLSLQLFITSMHIVCSMQNCSLCPCLTHLWYSQARSPSGTKYPQYVPPQMLVSCLTSIVVTSIRPQQLLTSGLFSIVSSQPNINVSIKSGIHTWQDPGISFMSCSHQPPTAAHSAHPQPYLAVMSLAASPAAHLPNQRVRITSGTNIELDIMSGTNSNLHLFHFWRLPMPTLPVRNRTTTLVSHLVPTVAYSTNHQPDPSVYDIISTELTLIHAKLLVSCLAFILVQPGQTTCIMLCHIWHP